MKQQDIPLDFRIALGSTNCSASDAHTYASAVLKKTKLHLDDEIVSAVDLHSVVGGEVEASEVRRHRIS